MYRPIQLNYKHRYKCHLLLLQKVGSMLGNTFSNTKTELNVTTEKSSGFKHLRNGFLKHKNWYQVALWNLSEVGTLKQRHQ